jgi:hypothetical protein
VLRAAAPQRGLRGRSPRPDYDWESLWIDYLDRVGRTEEAQAVRWQSFERTLSAERAKAFISRLSDFDDVEAEARAFAVASDHADLETALCFLMEWPALPEASRMIERRSEEIQLPAEAAERCAAKLRRRYPKAAHLLLRKAAAAACRRRDFKRCDRLTAEAETQSLNEFE